MADTRDKVTIDINVTGADKAAAEIGKTNKALTGSAKGTPPGQKPKGGLGGSAVSTTSRMAGLASTSSALGTVMGQVSPQVGAFGQIVGTAGASVSGLATAIGTTTAIGGATLLAALGLMAVASRNAARAQEELARAADLATAAVRRQKAAAAAELTAAGQVALVEEATGKKQALIKERGLAMRRARERAKNRPGGGLLAGAGEGVTRKTDVSQDPEVKRLTAQIRLQEELEKKHGDLAAEIRRREAAQDKTEPLPAAASVVARGGGGSRGVPVIRGRDEGAINRSELRRLEALQESQSVEDVQIAKFDKDDPRIDRELRWLEEQRKLQEESSELNKKQAADFEKTNAEISASYDQVRQAGTQAFGMVFATAVQQLADLAKGHEFAAGAFIESIGDQLVASGTQHVLQAAAYSFIPGLNISAPGLAAAGAAEIAGGIAMGAAGARMEGGTASGGGNAGGLGSARTGGPASPSFLDRGGSGGDSGPSTVIVNLSSTVAPNERDGERVLEALGKTRRVKGQAAFINAGIGT